MPTTEEAADSLTKGLGASRLPRIREDLKLIEASTSRSSSTWLFSLPDSELLVIHAESLLMSHLLIDRSPFEWASSVL